MILRLIKEEVGPWPMNCYILICEESRRSAVIDPGADAKRILKHIQDTQLDMILLTHGHFDHVGAVEDIKLATNAPVYLHPADAAHFELPFDMALLDGDLLQIGQNTLKAIHVPGHTPGQVCFDLGDGRIISGDTLFVGGPGKTWSAEDFEQTMRSLQETVFRWPDETRFFPGHGQSGTIGQERPAFETFVKGGWPAGLYGDVCWQQDG